MRKHYPLTDFQLKDVLIPVAKEWAKLNHSSVGYLAIFNYLQSRLGYSVTHPVKRHTVEKSPIILSLTLLQNYGQLAEVLNLPDESLKIVERCYIRETGLLPFIVSVEGDESKNTLTFSHAAMDDYRANLPFFISLIQPYTKVVTCFARSRDDAIKRAEHICEEPMRGSSFLRFILDEINPLEFVEFPDRRDTVYCDPLAMRLYYGAEIFVDRLKYWCADLPKNVQNEFLSVMNRGHAHTTHIFENVVHNFIKENPEYEP